MISPPHAVAVAGLLVLAARPAPLAAQAPQSTPPSQTAFAAASHDQAGSFLDTCAVAGFTINSGWWIDGIQVVCADRAPLPWRGGTGGGRGSFMLQPGERIIAIGGLTGGNAGLQLYSLQIQTDRRTSPVFGNGGAGQGDPGRMPFRLDVPPGYTLVGIRGRATGAVQSIGLVVAGPEAGGR